MNLIPRLTDAGRGLLIRALSGDTINFTRMKIGSGDYKSNPRVGDYWYCISDSSRFLHRLYAGAEYGSYSSSV